MPCETTKIPVKGYGIKFNSSNPYVNRVIVESVSVSTLTRLGLVEGELNVVGKVKIPGYDTKLDKTSNTTLKVTGPVGE